MAAEHLPIHNFASNDTSSKSKKSCTSSESRGFAIFVFHISDGYASIFRYPGSQDTIFLFVWLIGFEVNNLASSFTLKDI